MSTPSRHRCRRSVTGTPATSSSQRGSSVVARQIRDAGESVAGTGDGDDVGRVAVVGERRRACRRLRRPRGHDGPPPSSAARRPTQDDEPARPGLCGNGPQPSAEGVASAGPRRSARRAPAARNPARCRSARPARASATARTSGPASGAGSGGGSRPRPRSRQHPRRQDGLDHAVGRRLDAICGRSGCAATTSTSVGPSKTAAAKSSTAMPAGASHRDERVVRRAALPAHRRSAGNGCLAIKPSPSVNAWMVGP